MTELQTGSDPDGKTVVSRFVLFFGGAVLLGLGVALGAFLFSGHDRGIAAGDGDSEKNKIAGVVLETFHDVFGVSGRRQPVLEIDLRQKETKPLPEKTEIPAAPAAKKSKPAVQGIQGLQEGVQEKQEEQEAAVLDCEFDLVSAASRKVLFNEVAWMGTEANANDEWLELKNVSGGEVALSGWQILSKDGRIKFRFPDAVLKPGEFFLLERTDDDSLPDIKADAIYTGLLPNGGSWLKLFDRDCGVVDEINASGGWTGFGGDKIARKTLERNSGDLGWHTSSIVGGTPRKENSEPAPAVISVPPAETPPPSPSSQPAPAANVAGKININTAGYEELQKITGVGPVIAQRIIEYRNTNGPFQKLEDIKEVQGIGDAKFEKMKDEITL